MAGTVVTDLGRHSDLAKVTIGALETAASIVVLVSFADLLGADKPKATRADRGAGRPPTMENADPQASIFVPFGPDRLAAT